MIELPYPAKILWPNGRGHHMAKHREAKKHKSWAYHAKLATGGDYAEAEATSLRLIATFHPKTANAVDADNASGSLKAYQDGIAAAIGVDDRIFREPKIIFGAPVKGGKVFLTIEIIG